MKPKVRSKTRLRLGRLYFQCKRYVEWYFGNTKFAKQVSCPRKSCTYDVSTFPNDEDGGSNEMLRKVFKALGIFSVGIIGIFFVIQFLVMVIVLMGGFHPS